MVGTLRKALSETIGFIPSLAFPSLTFLKMRDQQTSAALGLPPRIHDEDCNVPRLVPSDLAETGVVPGTTTFGKQQDHHVLYPIEMVELAKICMLIFLRLLDRLFV